MNSRKRRDRYSRITSLGELEIEQLRLRLEVKRKELELLDNVDHVRDYFSYRNLYQVALQQVYSNSAIIRNATVRFRLARSIAIRLVDWFNERMSRRE